MDKSKPNPKPKLTPAEIEAGENEATYMPESPSEELRKSLMPSVKSEPKPKPRPAKKGYKSGGTVRGRGCETKGFGKGRFV
jgi:hypothetical protein